MLVAIVIHICIPKVAKLRVASSILFSYFFFAYLDFDWLGYYSICLLTDKYEYPIVFLQTGLRTMGPVFLGSTTGVKSNLTCASSLSDDELKRRLSHFGVTVGPINEATRSVYQTKLKQC